MIRAILHKLYSAWSASSGMKTSVVKIRLLPVQGASELISIPVLHPSSRIPKLLDAQEAFKIYCPFRNEIYRITEGEDNEGTYLGEAKVPIETILGTVRRVEEKLRVSDLAAAEAVTKFAHYDDLIRKVWETYDTFLKFEIHNRTALGMSGIFLLRAFKGDPNPTLSNPRNVPYYILQYLIQTSNSPPSLSPLITRRYLEKPPLPKKVEASLEKSYQDATTKNLMNKIGTCWGRREERSHQRNVLSHISPTWETARDYLTKTEGWKWEEEWVEELKNAEHQERLEAGGTASSAFWGPGVLGQGGEESK